MLDGVVRKLIEPPLDHMGKALARAGFSANALTLAGVLVGLGGAVLIAFEYYGPALVLILLSRLADGLDGAVARATQTSDFGGYFDIVADFLFYGAVPLGFAFADPQQNALVCAVLLLAFYFNGASFLGYAILAERQNLKSEARGQKNLFFTAGLLEGTETIGFFVILLVWPGQFALFGAIFAALTFVTALARLWWAYNLHRPSKAKRH